MVSLRYWSTQLTNADRTRKFPINQDFLAEHASRTLGHPEVIGASQHLRDEGSDEEQKQSGFESRHQSQWLELPRTPRCWALAPPLPSLPRSPQPLDPTL